MCNAPGQLIDETGCDPVTLCVYDQVVHLDVVCSCGCEQKRRRPPMWCLCVHAMRCKVYHVCTRNALRVSRVLQGDGSGGYIYCRHLPTESYPHTCAPCASNSLRTAVSPSIGNGDDSMVAVPTGHCCRPTSGLALAVLIQLSWFILTARPALSTKRLFQLLREGGVASWASALVTHGAWRYLPAPCVLWQRVCVLALGSIAARVGV